MKLVFSGGKSKIVELSEKDKEIQIETEQQLTINDKIDAIIRKIDNGSDPVFDKIALKIKNKE